MIYETRKELLTPVLKATPQDFFIEGKGRAWMIKLRNKHCLSGDINTSWRLRRGGCLGVLMQVSKTKEAGLGVQFLHS